MVELIKLPHCFLLLLLFLKCDTLLFFKGNCVSIKYNQSCIKKHTDEGKRDSTEFFPCLQKSALFTFLDPPTADVPEEKSTALQQEQKTSKIVTEEELEDWLDSMIS